jgi:hypothetical protein
MADNFPLILAACKEYNQSQWGLADSLLAIDTGDMQELAAELETTVAQLRLWRQTAEAFPPAERGDFSLCAAAGTPSWLRYAKAAAERDQRWDNKQLRLRPHRLTPSYIKRVIGDACRVLEAPRRRHKHPRYVRPELS